MRKFICNQKRENHREEGGERQTYFHRPEPRTRLKLMIDSFGLALDWELGAIANKSW